METKTTANIELDPSKLLGFVREGNSAKVGDKTVATVGTKVTSKVGGKFASKVGGKVVV